MLCCAVLCCAVLCCTVLCCAVLCCAVLCCAVLCCAAIFFIMDSIRVERDVDGSNDTTPSWSLSNID